MGSERGRVAIITGQLTVDNTVPTVLCTVPAGACNILISNIGPATAMVGPGPGPLINSGHFVFPGVAPTYWSSPSTSKGGPVVVAVTQNGQTATVSFMTCI